MANLNLNKVILGGRLTADPELKTTQSGVTMTNITVAVNRRFGEKQADGTTRPIADFINVQAWRQTAEFICQYFRKGSSICIVGSIQTRTWNDQNGNKRYTTEVIADEASFVDSKSDAQGAQDGGYMPSAYQSPPTAQTAPQSATAAPQTVPQFETIENDDGLPF